MSSSSYQRPEAVSYYKKSHNATMDIIQDKA
jgi:hypothetical protein